MRKMNGFNSVFSESSSQSRDLAQRRLVRLFILCIISVGLIGFRLWIYQIYQGEKYSTQARSNRLKIRRDKPLRGLVMDRNGQIIVSNNASYTLLLNRENCNAAEMKAIFMRLQQIVGIEYFNAAVKYEEAKNLLSIWPVKLMTNLSYAQLAVVEAHKYELPGIEIEVIPNRFYQFGRLAAQVLGYIGEVSKEELEVLRTQGYLPGDMVGKNGIEQSMNLYLHGVNGYKVVEVNALGQVIRTLGDPPPIIPIPGAQIKLTIDLNLQRFVETLLEGYKGSVIVMNARTGEILTLASSPTYNPNLFTSGISYKEWQILSKDEALPFMNRGIQATFPPGSTFKPLMALAALEAGVINENTTFSCPGYYDFYGHTFRCWKKGGHGGVSVRRAIEQSCNVFFYNVGTILGIESIAKYAKKFGLGVSTGIDLKNERTGLFPDPVWKLKASGQKWYQGETVSVSIGQGGVVVTPLQLLVMMNTIGTGGYKVKPHIIKNIIPYRNLQEFKLPNFTPEKIEIAPSNLLAVREGLWMVVNAGGTAKRACIKDLNIAGKTGTAQVVKRSKTQGLSDAELDPKYRDHSWFVSFAPFDDPQISCVVLLENGGKQGAKDKLEIAKRIYLYYMKGEYLPMETPQHAANR